MCSRTGVNLPHGFDEFAAQVSLAFFFQASHMMQRTMPTPRISGTMHPSFLPTILCLPLSDSGMPSLRDSLPWAWEMPKARLHEKDKPGMNFMP